MVVACHDGVSLCGNGAFEKTIISRIFSDDGNLLTGFDGGHQGRIRQHKCPLLEQVRSEKSAEHLEIFLEDIRRDGQHHPAVSPQLHDIPTTTAPEAGNEDVGVQNDSTFWHDGI